MYSTAAAGECMRTAANITVGTPAIPRPLSARMDFPKDVDYFRFTVPSTGNYRFQVGNTTAVASWEMRWVYHDGNREREIEVFSGNSTLNFVRNNIAPGTYFLAVTNRNERVLDYDITITRI